MTFALMAETISACAETADGDDPFTLAALFYEKAQRETDAGPVAAWTLLATALNGRFEPTNRRDPYSEPATSALTRDSANELSPLVPHLRVAALRARLADLIWLRTRPFAMGRLAMDSYFAAAQRAEDPTHWLFAPDLRSVALVWPAYSAYSTILFLASSVLSRRDIKMDNRSS